MYLSIFLFLRLSVYLSIYLSIYLPTYLSIYDNSLPAGFCFNEVFSVMPSRRCAHAECRRSADELQTCLMSAEICREFSRFSVDFLSRAFQRNSSCNLRLALPEWGYSHWLRKVQGAGFGSLSRLIQQGLAINATVTVRCRSWLPRWYMGGRGRSSEFSADVCSFFAYGE